MLKKQRIIFVKKHYQYGMHYCVSETITASKITTILGNGQFKSVKFGVGAIEFHEHIFS